MKHTNHISILTRVDFRRLVFDRDKGLCVNCRLCGVDAHHIIDRKLFSDGGYYLDNGATLCSECHVKAEKGILSPEDIRRVAKIETTILPDGFDETKTYDKWGKVMPDFLKYPSTTHIVGSSIQTGDKSEYIPLEFFEGKFLVIEEKIDGANTGISFDENLELKLQSRGHYLDGGDYSQFDQFKSWASVYTNQLFDILGDRYIMYGEWMSNFHSLYYDMLPHYFMEFDIFDTIEGIFLSTKVRKALTNHPQFKIHHVLVLAAGICVNGRIDGTHIYDYVGKSNFQSDQAYDLLCQELDSKNVERKEVLAKLNRDRLMEGLYIKWECDGEVKGRYKYVREDFVQTILNEGKHHLSRPVIKNRLKDGTDLYQNS